MLGGRDEQIELECAQCGARVKTTAAEAEKGIIRCPRGHSFEVMAALGEEALDTGPTTR